MYKVEKTNKKTVVHQFETFELLQAYAEKNRYGQGYISFYENGIRIDGIGSLYNLNSFCTDLSLKNKGIL